MKFKNTKSVAYLYDGKLWEPGEILEIRDNDGESAHLQAEGFEKVEEE